MIDTVCFALAGLAATGGGGFLAGLRLGARRALPPPANLCDCAHVHGEHDADGGACLAEIERPRFDPLAGRRIGREHVPCPCRVYNGPPPLEWFPVLPSPPALSGKDN